MKTITKEEDVDSIFNVFKNCTIKKDDEDSEEMVTSANEVIQSLIDEVVPYSLEYFLAIRENDEAPEGIQEEDEEFVGQTKVDNKNLVFVLVPAHQKIVRLDVSMNDSSRVDVLDDVENLVSQDQSGFQGEFSGTSVEHIFQRGSHKVHHHDICFVFLPCIVDPWNPFCEGNDVIMKIGVDFSLVKELRVPRVGDLSFDGHLAVGFHIYSVKNLSKGPVIDFLSNHKVPDSVSFFGLC